MRPPRRQTRVRDVHYDLAFDLVGGSAEYAGRATITFEVVPGDSPIWLDATGGEPFVTLDGRALSSAVDGHRIMLPDGHGRRVRRWWRSTIATGMT